MKDERVYLGHIRDAINDIEEYASAGRDMFMAERMREDAIIRKLETIGEAIKQLSNATKDRRSEIRWKQIAAMRDRLTHDYFGVGLVLVWRVIERDLPVLKAAVITLIRSGSLREPEIARHEVGAEVGGRSLDAWAYAKNVTLRFIRPASRSRTPTSRASTGSFVISA